MSILRTKLFQEIFETPLMIHPGKAKAAMIGLGGRIVDGGVVFSEDGIAAIDHWVDPQAGILSGRMANRMERDGHLPFDIVNGVAVIPIEGTLVHKGSYIGQSSGETSYQGIQTQVALAEKSPQVRGVVFEIDSYGGAVAGAFETAEMMRRLSAIKPTMSILTDFALSAGYLLASQARQIAMPNHGSAGSIGVITMHADFSRQLEEEGVTVTILTAGEKKAKGNPFEQLDAVYADDVRGQLEGMRKSFAEAVSAGRKGRISVADALGTEAGCFEGAEAKKLGLVDAIGNPNDVFAEFVAAVNRAR
ncbi:S49 family peptidase [uncultured Cohaesibacter sp.]|uniref:S49 family peptidase n=1 Tax=uncultured Cohaesibacter sp. TaxID=1002546 RepID=UPI0029C60FA1|nr:S49 family peptidase [uncultured Cohaesibacter sp.]